MELLAVFTTVTNEMQAEALASGAVAQHLAACVHQEPIRSTYRWKGELETSDEIRLMFKTSRERGDALIAWLAAQHPYELPAIFALPVTAATSAYADWVVESVRPPQGSQQA